MSSIVSTVKCKDLSSNNQQGSEGGKGSMTIEDFFSEVIVKLLEEKPQNPYGMIEQFCNLVKHGTFVPPKERSAYERLTKLYKPWMGIDDENILEKDTQRARKYVEIVNPPVKTKTNVSDEEGGEEATEEEGADDLKMSDLLYEGKLFRDAGIGLGEMELFQVLVSMNALVIANKKINSIRFFGKILGIENNYYILETEQTKDEAENETGEETKKVEDIPPEVEGTNKYIYYVSNTAGCDVDMWTQLPDAKPEYILRSRKIKKFFTGKLEHDVLSHPPFKGKEIDLLRSQIARISHSTILVPKGRMKSSTEEDETEHEELKLPPNVTLAKDELPTVEKDEEFEEKIKNLDISQVTNWVNLLPTILSKQGRCTQYWTEEEKEKPDFEDMKKTVERIPKPLSSISEENWIARTCGMLVDNEVVALSSRIWQGAHCVGYKRNPKDMVFANVYIGYGIKTGGEVFSPQFVLPVLDEYHEIVLTQQHDPSIEDMKRFIPRKKEASDQENEDQTDE
ncbi:hypothetical protein FDP41_004743 [Naegleria fowleri]|uniref:Radial spokehead-like protein n=1 Tax=Naegleria fowleri TaxID=5763 RepID=A0A6A5BGG6_NAEFO|nr:uncharacterized protein FDP41_004743 [Naegleria fowleri]KAF0976067.1 hypothetical protein FDP41_004743 [Naegleria fowleri]